MQLMFLIFFVQRFLAEDDEAILSNPSNPPWLWTNQVYFKRQHKNSIYARHNNSFVYR